MSCYVSYENSLKCLCTFRVIVWLPLDMNICFEIMFPGHWVAVTFQGNIILPSMFLKVLSNKWVGARGFIYIEFHWHNSRLECIRYKLHCINAMPGHNKLGNCRTLFCYCYFVYEYKATVMPWFEFQTRVHRNPRQEIPFQCVLPNSILALIGKNACTFFLEK